MLCFTASQVVICSSFLKENTSWKKVFSFDEINGVHGDQCETDRPPTTPTPAENEFLNYIVADETPDFLVNLLSRDCRILRNKS